VELIKQYESFLVSTTNYVHRNFFQLLKTLLQLSQVDMHIFLRYATEDFSLKIKHSRTFEYYQEVFEVEKEPCIERNNSAETLQVRAVSSLQALEPVIIARDEQSSMVDKCNSEPAAAPPNPSRTFSEFQKLGAPKISLQSFKDPLPSNPFKVCKGSQGISVGSDTHPKANTTAAAAVGVSPVLD
jgi:hypothetical protein